MFYRTSQILNYSKYILLWANCKDLLNSSTLGNSGVCMCLSSAGSLLSTRGAFCPEESRDKIMTPDARASKMMAPLRRADNTLRAVEDAPGESRQGTLERADNTLHAVEGGRFRNLNACTQQWHAR